MNKLLALFTLLLIAFISWQPGKTNPEMTLPGGYEAAEEDPLYDSLKQVYRQQLYYAAPGTNVDSIRYENWKRTYAYKRALREGVGSRSVTEYFASNQIEAVWHERGPINEAGDMREIDFDPATENFYAISTVGHLWKGNLNGNTWTKLNDDIRFQADEIEVVPYNGGQRIFAIYGTGVDDKKIRFSDDEGQTWTTGTGFSFYDHWGRGRRLYSLSDNQTLYYLVHTWSGSPWGQLMQLYKSTDRGVSYTKVWDTPVGYEGEDVDLWKPYNSNEMYLVDNRAQKYYKVTHDFNFGETTISTPVDFSAQGIDIGGVHLTGRYNTAQAKYELYLNHDTNQKVYKALYGDTWTLLSTAPENVWRKGWLADPGNTNLYIGGFQLNKSSNGVNWVEQYPQWWRYYSHSKDSMHVDMMSFNYFEKANGTPFIIVLDHAGVHVTYDHFQTTANLGLQDLNVVTLYDQSTASDGFVYCGAQDKGTFKYSGNSLANFNKFSTDNMTTGDGMLGVFFNSDQSFYSMLQNGGIQCIRNREVRSSSSYNIPGDHKPGWINPIVATPDFTDNRAYAAGGNINGGSGSYLLNVNVNIASGVSWQVSQYNYDFRANSNNGTSVIKAIGVSMSDFNRLYVSTQDATFFSSSNQGTSWTKHTTAGLPSTMIPWDIKTSNTNPNKVFICGTGFSNTGVYRSTNGGSTFSPLTGSIPSATFYEVALSDDESLLFAATSEGPYVYVFEDQLWYTLHGVDTPVLDFNTVDNVGNNVIRFGTYGRGIWDLQITNVNLPVEMASFTARPIDQTKVQLDWTTAAELNIQDYVVEHSTDGIAFKALGTVTAKGKPAQYTYIHANPVKGDNYYRLQIRERDGSTSYSAIQVVNFSGENAAFDVWPNLLSAHSDLYVHPAESAETWQLTVYNLAGMAVYTYLGTGDQRLNTALPKGVYVYIVGNEQVKSTGKLVVQ